MKKYYIFLLISSFVVILDQLTKWLVRQHLVLYSRIELLPFFDFTHVRNQGAAFGMLRDLPDTIRIPLFVLVLVLAVLAISVFLIKAPATEKILIVALSLIFGGAIGNSIDRFRLRYVTDFIDFHWFGNPNYHWPPFNIADSAITVGVIIIFIDTFLLKKGKSIV